MRRRFLEFQSFARSIDLPFSSGSRASETTNVVLNRRVKYSRDFPQREHCRSPLFMFPPHLPGVVYTAVYNSATHRVRDLAVRRYIVAIPFAKLTQYSTARIGVFALVSRIGIRGCNRLRYLLFGRRWGR